MQRPSVASFCGGVLTSSLGMGSHNEPVGEGFQREVESISTGLALRLPTTHMSTVTVLACDLVVVCVSGASRESMVQRRARAEDPVGDLKWRGFGAFEVIL